MASKTVHVEFPRSAVLEIADDAEFGRNLHNAILDAEYSGEPSQVQIGKSRKKAVVIVQSA